MEGLDTNKKVALGVLGATTVAALAAFALYLFNKVEDEYEDVSDDEEDIQKPTPEPEDPITARANELKAKGNAAFKAEQFLEAIQFYTEALEMKGLKDPHLIHSNRSAAHFFLKQYNEALADGMKCIELNPDWQKGYFRAAKASFAMEKYDETYTLVYTGLLKDRSNPELSNFLESTRKYLGASSLDTRTKLDENMATRYYKNQARSICEDVLQISYEDIEAIVKDWVAEEGESSIFDIEKIDQLMEEHPIETGQVLVEILVQSSVKKYNEALAVAEKVREKISPNRDARVYLLLINTTMRTLQSLPPQARLSTFGQAVEYCREGLKLDPANVPLSHMYAALLTNYTGGSAAQLPMPIQEALSELNTILKNPKTNRLIIADSGIRIWFKLFEDESITNDLMEEERNNTRNSIPEDQAYIYGITQGAFGRLVMEKFFLSSLAYVLFNNPAIEKILTPFRKAFLTLSYGPEFLQLEPIIHGIALQCWRSNNAWSSKVEEDEKVCQLEEEVDGILSADIDSLVVDGELDHTLHHHLALIALYKPLSSVKRIDELIPKVDLSKLHPWFADILQKTVLDHIEELELRKEIKELTRIPESEEKDFYNSLTPAWDSAGFYAGRLTTIPIDLELTWLFPKFVPQGEFKKVLFAGCGSGQEIYQACTLYENIEATGIDISINQLAYAARQNKALGVNNVSFYLADVMSLEPSSFEESQQPFDMIISNSLIHDLSDPLEGLKRLAALVRPGGLIKVSVHNREYLAFVKLGREFLSNQARRGPRLFDPRTSPPKVMHAPTKDDLRRTRADILDGESDTQALLEVPGFYSLDEFKEMLFHPQVNAAGFSDIGNWIDELGMKLIGFDFGGISQETTLQYRVEYPDDPDLTNPAHLEEFSSKHSGAFDNFSHHTTFLIEKAM